MMEASTSPTVYKPTDKDVTDGRDREIMETKLQDLAQEAVGAWPVSQYRVLFEAAARVPYRDLGIYCRRRFELGNTEHADGMINGTWTQ
jgi:hypothetical protein